MGLRGVFNNRQAMSISNRLDAIYLCWHAKEMDWDNRFCSWRDRRLKLGGTHCSTRRVDIYKNWFRSDIANRPCSSYKGHRNRNHFISRPDIETAQGKVERARATVEAHAMTDSAVGCEFLLKV